MKKFAVILLTICLMSVMLCACTADSGGMDADAETPEPNNDFYDWGMDHISMKDISPDVFLEVPLYRQASSYTCGVACTLSILRYAGYDFDLREDRLAATLGSTPEDGTNYHSIVDYLNSVYYEEEDNLMFEAEAKMEMTIDDLMACLAASAGAAVSGFLLAGKIGRQRFVCGLICGAFYALCLLAAAFLVHGVPSWTRSDAMLPLALLLGGPLGGALSAIKEGH